MDVRIVIRSVRWARCWDSSPATRCSNRVSTPRSATDASSAPATARRRVSTLRRIKLITAVAWPVWTASKTAARGPSPIRCGGGNRTRLPRRKDAFRRFAPPVPRPGGHRGLLRAPGAGEEGRRRAGGDRRQEDSEPCHARRSARSAEPAALQRPLHGMPVVCFGVSQSGVASVGQADDPHAARNVVRTWILPSRMYQVFGSVSGRCNPADNES